MNNDIFCLGHISVDIFVSRSALDSLKVGGCIDSRDISINSGGDVANVAYWLGLLGVPTSMLGIVGKDSMGQFLKNDLQDVGVKCVFKYTNEHPTASILIVVEKDGERSFIINGTSQDQLNWEDLPLSEITTSKLFYTTSYTCQNEPIKSVIRKLFKYIKDIKNPKPLMMFNLASYTTIQDYRTEIKENILPYTDILVGNREEFSILVEKSVELAQEIFSLGRQIQTEYPSIKTILVTDGEKGCYYITPEHVNNFVAPKVTVIDTTGAGDGFCAGFISEYVLTEEITTAIKKGIELGSTICKGYGARYQDQKEIKR